MVRGEERGREKSEKNYTYRMEKLSQGQTHSMPDNSYQNGKNVGGKKKRKRKK